MNDTLFQILIISFSLIFITSLAMLFLHRPKAAVAAAVVTEAPPSPVRVIEKVDPHALSRVKWKHPANRSVLVALRARRVGETTTIDSPAEDGTVVPGAHPDIAEYVLDTLRGELPEICRWIVYGLPVLVHPRSGIIFAFGMGSECVALRLPIDQRSECWTDECALEDDCLTAAELGADWAFMQDVAAPDEPLAAYEYAAWL